MSRKVKVASMQMDATHCSLSERLERAGDLIAEAVSSGAELLVLPECFNTGYAYVDENYALSETADGETVTWMKAQAQQHNVHLVGTLLLREGDDIYNRALLFAPDGNMWRYDKRFPFLWERAYFREGAGITIADTKLGKIGMMICWDSAHADLWQEYAGQIDLMLVPSSPPSFNGGAEIVFPDGERTQGWMESSHFADQDIRDQAKWLQVPVIHSAGSGTFRSPMPLTRISLMGFLLDRPSEWLRILRGGNVKLEVRYDRYTQVINAQGEVAGRVTTEGDGYTLAEVELPQARQTPTTPQPEMRTEPIAYFFADKFGPALLRFVYMMKKGKQ